MKKDVFQSATIKLTLLYVSIVMVICLLFSVWVYNASLNQIQTSFVRPPGPVEQMVRRENRRFAQEIDTLRNEALATARSNLLVQLTLLNVVIAVAGGIGSYVLARHTLQPIKKSHQSLERFTADASHELRTPITAMQTETEVTLSDSRLTLKDAKAQLESNLEELNKLTHISENMLMLARLDNQKLEKTTVDIQTLVDDALQRVSSQLKQKNQEIIKNIKQQNVFVEPQSITQAMVTILDNASKFSPKNSCITLTTEKKSNILMMSIHDQGSGIDTKDIPYIFQRFYQADSSRTKSKQRGYGIGLSIAYAAVKANGGEITVTSSKKGSTFTLQLPLS